MSQKVFISWLVWWVPPRPLSWRVYEFHLSYFASVCPAAIAVRLLCPSALLKHTMPGASQLSQSSQVPLSATCEMALRAANPGDMAGTLLMWLWRRLWDGGHPNSPQPCSAPLFFAFQRAERPPDVFPNENESTSLNRLEYWSNFKWTLISKDEVLRYTTWSINSGLLQHKEYIENWCKENIQASFNYARLSFIHLYIIQTT